MIFQGFSILHIAGILIINRIFGIDCMKRRFPGCAVIFLIAVASVLFGSNTGSAVRNLPSSYTEKLDSIPDLTQTDPNGNLPGGGRFYCAAVAVSNSLVWFADNGFSRLMPALKDRKKAQFAMARTLGSKRYLNTSLKTGNDADSVLKGLARYLVDNGYKHFQLEYQGWCRHPLLFGTGVREPQVSWIKRGIIGDSVVWLNAGWYSYDPSSNRYYRFGEHWLSLVGYGVDRSGRQDENTLIVHDPAPRAGKESSHTYIKLQPLTSGRLAGKPRGLPRKAKGYYMLAGDMRIHRRADYAILDGAVVLRMKLPE